MQFCNGSLHVGLIGEKFKAQFITRVMILDEITRHNYMAFCVIMYGKLQVVLVRAPFHFTSQLLITLSQFFE